MRKNIIFTVFWAALTFFGLMGNAYAEDPIYTGTFNNNAISGYDAVSYFSKDGVPVKGSKKFKTKWNGATWLFSSEENLNKFKSNQTKYAPQYGGYCAWAAAHETLAKSDPKAYTIVNGKLYLNYNKSIRDKWLPRKEELIPLADENYPELIELP